MDSAGTPNELLVRCLMCGELKGAEDFQPDGLYWGLRDPRYRERHWYCKGCGTIQRAHAKTYLRERFNWTEPDPPLPLLLDGIRMGARWRDYIIEYLFGSTWAAITQPVIFSPERYRGANAPALNDGLPSVWRIRFFHTQRQGYAEGWWNPQTGRWEWSLRTIDLDAPTAEWSEWRKAIRDATGAGRPLGTALIYLATVEAFLSHVREVVSEGGWAMALPGADAITRKRVCQSVRAGRVTQAQLGEILGCDRRTIGRALARFKKENQLDWPDLRQQIARWSHES